jgi:hypothetical protein
MVSPQRTSDFLEPLAILRVRNYGYYMKVAHYIGGVIAAIGRLQHTPRLVDLISQALSQDEPRFIDVSIREYTPNRPFLRQVVPAGYLIRGASRGSSSDGFTTGGLNNTY